MSVNDMIKKSVLNSFSQYNVPKMALALLVALLVGIVIYCVYRRFYTGVVYSRSFAVTLVGMCVLTCMVTLAISTNIVISLGMVGALSIVRYRTAVKDPMDLLYLFWAITSGIAAGAGMYLLVVVAGAVMIGMLALFYSHQDKGRVYIAVIHYASDAVGDDITRAFGRTKFFVKSKTMRGDHVEMAVEVFCDDKDMTFAERIRAIEGVEDVTLRSTTTSSASTCSPNAMRLRVPSSVPRRWCVGTTPNMVWYLRAGSFPCWNRPDKSPDWTCSYGVPWSGCWHVGNVRAAIWCRFP